MEAGSSAAFEAVSWCVELAGGRGSSARVALFQDSHDPLERGDRAAVGRPEPQSPSAPGMIWQNSSKSLSASGCGPLLTTTSMLRNVSPSNTARCTM